MDWWDDATSAVSDWWDDEGKDKLEDKAKDTGGDLLDDAMSSMKGWFSDDSETKSVKEDAAAQPHATQRSVENVPTAKKSGGINWQAAGVGVGLLGLAAKFM